MMKILYAGQLDPYGTCYSRLTSLKQINTEISTFAADGFYRSIAKFSRFERDLRHGRLAKEYTSALIEQCKSDRPDVLWLDTGDWLTKSGLFELKRMGVFRVRHMTDALYPKRQPVLWLRRSRLRSTTPYFDFVFTSNEEDYKNLSRKMPGRVSLTDLAYDDRRFMPSQITEADKDRWQTDISFVGHYEPRTAKYVLALVNAGLNVVVFGHDAWFRKPVAKQLGPHLRPRLSNSEYEMVLRTTKIGLCCVSQWNYNQTAARSFEIPASGTFLLAMRTERHQYFFQEGHEADFFSSPDELVEKAAFYLANPAKRDEIAAAGRQRCLTSGYSWDSVTKRDFERLLVAYDSRTRE